MNIDTQYREILKGVDSVLPGPDALMTKLKSAEKEGRPLRVKLGIDPSGTDIHVGHTVTLWKLRQFQDLGHQAVLIVGDYTAMLGDPSGRDSVRPQLTHEQVLENAESYKRQISRIVDLERAEVVPNGSWFTDFRLSDVIRLGATTTLMRMLERKDFKERVEEQRPLYIHELLYPLMQGWDSVEIRADIELGGTDQVFNILKGRDLMELKNQTPQIGIVLPLLIGLDGEKKMGKSMGNYIGLHDQPQDMYGKVMSIPDKLILNYWELAVPSTVSEVDRIKSGLTSGELGPMDAKLSLAKRLTALYHSEESAEAAANHFQRVVRDKAAPDEIPTLTLARPDLPLRLLELTHLTGEFSSKGASRRRIQENGVRLNGAIVSDPFAELSPDEGDVLRVSKRSYFRISLG